jgi:hypothetical protein
MGQALRSTVQGLVKHLVQEEAEEVEWQCRQGGLVPRQPHQELAMRRTNTGQPLVKLIKNW